MKSLIIGMLLGVSDRIFLQSREFEAFRTGLNLNLTPTIPSFSDVSIIFQMTCHEFIYICRLSGPPPSIYLHNLIDGG